jgi:hypothetical protein
MGFTYISVGRATVRPPGGRCRSNGGSAVAGSGKYFDVQDSRSYPWHVTVPQGESTFRAGLGGRIMGYVSQGAMLAFCVLVVFIAYANSGWKWPTVVGVLIMFTFAAVGTVVVVRWAGRYVGTTTLRKDGLLITLPCRRSRFMPWSEIDSVMVDALDLGRGMTSMGLRAAVDGKGFFLPGLMARGPSDAVFKRRVEAIEAAWQRTHPQAPGKHDSRARKRRR